MVRRMLRLSVKSVAAKKRTGYFADGGGLNLQVSSTGSKSWVLRYMLNLKAREMGLGSQRVVTLAEARGKAEEARKLLADGIDPLEARNAKDAQAALTKARSISFSKCAESYITAHRAGWRNAKHADQWTNTIKTYAGPVFGPLPVQDIDVALVLKVLEPIWTEKPETASRLRARIERVLDWATVRGYRSGENPARWHGHLDKLLPALKKKSRVKHHPALPFADASTFMASLRAQEGTAARALEFTVLTIARTGETIGAKWAEIDLNAAIWTVPASRMKAGKAHRVPLSPQVLKLLRSLPREGEYVFPGRNAKRPLSNMAMLELLRRMDREDLTVHGFRSTFRDWASESTNYPREVCEQALAHSIADAVEAAYRRGDLFEKRRRLMAEWAKHCDRAGDSAAVVPMRRKGA